METGYITPSGPLFWRNWTQGIFLVFSGKLPGTYPAFVGFNKLSGFRCHGCELVVMRYGNHKMAHAPTDQE